MSKFLKTEYILDSRNAIHAACALMLISAVAIAPTAALAKKGDLYVNSDGSCDKGDTKKGYWCVESMAFDPRTAGNDTGSAKSKAITRIYQTGEVDPNLSTKTVDKPGSLINRPENPLP